MQQPKTEEYIDRKREMETEIKSRDVFQARHTK